MEITFTVPSDRTAKKVMLFVSIFVSFSKQMYTDS